MTPENMLKKFEMAGEADQGFHENPLDLHWRQSYLPNPEQPWRHQADSLGETCVMCMIEIPESRRLEILSPLVRGAGGSSRDHTTIVSSTRSTIRHR